MVQLLLVGAAAWMAYQVVHAVVPIPAPLQHLLVVAACYGLTRVPPEVLAALDAAAVAAALRLVVLRLQGPVPDLVRPRIPRRPARPSRIPDLP